MKPANGSRSPIPWLATGAALLLGALFLMRPEARALRGDEGTFVAMATSLARDHDLRFDTADRRWAQEHAGGAVGVILQRTPRGIFYSKPVLYPLLAAPFVALVGEWGPALPNLVALLLGSLLMGSFLARLGNARAARDTLLTFLGAGVPLAYLVWRMTESLQLGLSLAGLALAFAASARAPQEPARSRTSRLLASRVAGPLGGLLLGLLASLREPNALLVAGPVLAAVLARRWRAGLGIALGALVGYGLVLGATVGLAGASNPYRAVRSTFNADTGYPAGDGAAASLARFEDRNKLATSTLGLSSELDSRRSAYAALYFLVGRHSGLVAYFPGALLFFLVALRRPGFRGASALLALAGTALFYLLWMPGNYFGGETFLGNRYILSALPCTLVALPRLPSLRVQLVAWLVATAVGISALLSVATWAAIEPSSQCHAYAGIFRLLPYESVASSIDGRRDRYWSGDFLRFVDPFARVRAWSFELASGTPAAEVEIATSWSGETSRWIVHADAARATLVTSDWTGTTRHALATIAGRRSGGPLLLQSAPAWRRHRFWWPVEQPYDVRVLRFRLESGDGSPVTARLRYLGRQTIPETGFGREVEHVELPAVASAGGTLSVPLTLVNRGEWPWIPAAALPVALGARFEPLDAASELLEARAPLPREIRPGERVVMTAELAAPARPGSYRMVLDLVLEDVTWFASRVGAPLAQGTLEVRGP